MGGGNMMTVLKPSTCRYCGAPITQPVGKKLFCSVTCRLSYYQAHPESIHKKAFYKFKCDYCGKEFKAYGNQKRKYCSHECYTKARFGTKEERADAKQNAIQQRAAVPAMCLACPYYAQVQTAHKA